MIVVSIQIKLLSLCEIGSGVLLNSGVVIGSEGYGFEQIGSIHEKFHIWEK